ncbi:hypothetical protein TW95_gp1329 [Pandoravirus inopinatum]|uniref:Uncharacterized protein n=1 Tax=Pandoravirus inopinatum TaxID=1605721 RepID=A0A0B5IYU7_9VIRU|nr:hypothetical protein TW95_gp1329 [Pandoravirus inopinatum]AJF98063.1 hypothetical protein [Pandoravirus inopinatum]
MHRHERERQTKAPPPLVLASSLGRARRRAPWAAANTHTLLPTASPFCPPPVGPYYPLGLRDMSRVALTLAPARSTPAPAQTMSAELPTTTTTTTTTTLPIEDSPPRLVGIEIAPAMVVHMATPHNGTFKRPSPVVPIGTRYTLTRDEVRECARIGHERNRRNRDEGRASRRYTAHRTDDDISVQGVIGEWAFARLFDLSIDIHDTSCRSACSETRFDAIMTPEGWTVDVKTTVGRNAPMRVAGWKVPNPPDVYALLVYVNYDPVRPLDARIQALPVIEFRGFASSATVFAPESRIDTVARDGQRGVIYVVAQDRLVDRAGLAVEAGTRPGGTLRHQANVPLSSIALDETNAHGQPAP